MGKAFLEVLNGLEYICGLYITEKINIGMSNYVEEENIDDNMVEISQKNKNTNKQNKDD